MLLIPCLFAFLIRVENSTTLISFQLVLNLQCVGVCLSHQAVIETLSVGATMLLPPLRERMELLHSLLPQGPDRWESLSKGQVPVMHRAAYLLFKVDLKCAVLDISGL